MKVTIVLIVIFLIGCSTLQAPDLDQIGDNTLVPMPPLLEDCGITYKDSDHCDALSNGDLSAEY